MTGKLSSFYAPNIVDTFALSKDGGYDMSQFMIHLQLEDYLVQWLHHEYGDPIVFPRNSAENDVIELGITTLPKDTAPNLPSDGNVAIQLPTFKYKDTRNKNFLPKKGRNALKRCIRARFQICLWQDLHKFGNIGEQKQDLIYVWMEAHGIEATETNFNTISKIYQRKRESYRKQVYRNKNRKK